MIIEVWTREKYAAGEESDLIGRLARSGLAVKEARLSRLYKVEAPFPRSAFDRIARELLADRITEYYSISVRPGLKKFHRVDVWLKDSVTDVVGESVGAAVRDVLGEAPAGVRFGRAYYLACVSGRGLRRAVAAVLANEIVNIYGLTKGEGSKDEKSG